MGNCWGSPPSNPISSTPTHLSSAISQTTSNATASGSSNISANSHFSAPSSDEVYPGGQILPAPNLRIFGFAELKVATKNFRADTVLGEGGFGKVFKGWLEDKGQTKSGSGTVIAVKKLNSESLQGFQEWQVLLLNLREKFRVRKINVFWIPLEPFGWTFTVLLVPILGFILFSSI